MTEIKKCENFIAELFAKYDTKIEDFGIEINLFWKLAEERGLHIPGTFGGPMSKALEKMCSVKTRNDESGNYILTAFVLNK